MKPESLQRALAIRGLISLGVRRHHCDPDVLVIYLHGNAGQWPDGFARRLVARIPGVLAVEDSGSTQTILLALTRPNGEGPGPEAARPAALP